jgi:chromate transporter
MPDAHDTTASKNGTAGEVFLAFLGQGLTAFGGPVAHLGYFRQAFVVRRGWLGEAAYADLVALCQFLPGPASSQVGMAIGLRRAGYPGMLAAWTGFTLPSALLMMAFAFGADDLAAVAGTGWIAGLKAAAVAIVAHALIGMARALAPDAQRAGIAAAGTALALLMPHAFGQLLVILSGGLLGRFLLRTPAQAAVGEAALAVPGSRRSGLVFLGLFLALLALLPALAALYPGGALRLIDSFYRAGALVFGGGHVVLPLLQAEMVSTGLVERETFLAGYGAAQAVPGPLFTFAAFLGAAATQPPNGYAGAAIALLAIFAPSALLVLGALPFWERLRANPAARATLMGINAAVVGLLAAALYDPVMTGGLTSPTAAAIAVTVFGLLWLGAPSWALVVAAGLAGLALL